MVALSRPHEATVLRHRQGGPVAVKAAQPGLVEGYLVTWGHPKDTDLEREFFTRNTNLCLDWFPVRPVLYHHGMDGTVGLKAIGVIKSIELDDIGAWVQAQLDMRDKYAQAVYGMVKADQFGWSSGSVEHLVQVAGNGEILQWPVIEGSITPTPAQPAKTNVYAGGVKTSLGAFKAVLSATPYAEQVLRELDARVAAAAQRGSVISRVKSQQPRSNPMTVKLVDRLAARRVAAAALAAYGIKADPEDLEAVAQDVEPVLEEEVASVMQDEFDETTMQDDEFDPSMMEDEFDESMMADEELALGLMADEEFDPSMMQDPLDETVMADEEFDAQIEAIMADLEEDATMQDDLEEATMRRKAMREALARPRPRVRTRRTQPRARGKSVQDEVRSLRRRIQEMERAEYPGESYVGRGSVKSMRVTDQADREGAYVDAFKSYLRVGLAGLYDHQKYNLRRGQDNWGPADSVVGPGGPNRFKALPVKAFNIGMDTSVGYAVPPDWINELNKNIMEETVMAADCRTRTTTSDRIVQPDLRTTDARRVYPTQVRWPGESPPTQAATEADEFNLSQIEIPVHVMLLNYVSTLSALEDTAFDLQAEITAAFGEAVAVAYDDLIWSGDGQGKLYGIVNNPDVTGAASSSMQSVGGYVPSGSASGITNGDPIKQMLYNLPKGYRTRAKWYANSNTMLEVATLKTADGLYLWDVHNEAGLRGGMPTTLLGLPVVFNEFADDIAANGFPMILADLSRGYTIGQRVDFSVRRFDEVLATRDQVLFIGRARVGGQVTQPAAFKALKIATS